MHFVPALIWFAALVAGSSAVFALRFGRAKRIQRVTPAAITRLPVPEAVDWRIRNSSEAAVSSLTEGTTWAAIDAGAATLPLIEAAHEINPVVIESLSRWVNYGEMMNAPSLFEYVRDHHEAIFSAHSDLGFLHALEGYVGEAFAAHDLSTGGHDVFMPDATNVPGWDLNVDGHLMQVKVGKDALQHAHQALAAHPEFHIITDPVTAHALDHAVGLQDLAPDHLDAVTQHTMQGADALAHAGSFHFPVVTAIVSSVREIDLLSAGSTDMTTALKNAGLDVAGTGGGLMAGAKAGALAGMWLGPHGAAVGAILGGIAGAIGGRTFTNSVKRAALEKALAEYDAGRASATARIQRLQLETQGRIRHDLQRADLTLRKHYGDEQKQFALTLASHDSRVAENVEAIADDFTELLKELRENLHRGLARFTEAQRFSRLRFLIWPSEQDVAVVKARAWVADTDRKIAEAIDRIAVLGGDRSTQGRRALVTYIANFTASNPFDARDFAGAVRERAATIRECEAKAAELRNSLVCNLTEYTVRAKHTTDVRIAEVFIALSRDIQTAVDRCKGLHAKVTAEAAKLGLSM
ncbi:MAG: hypothetical protein ACXWC3_13110 [Burkholderiales bacterium]